MKKSTIIALVVAIVLAIAGAITGATVNIKIEEEKYNATIEYSEEPQPAYVEDDKGEIVQEEAIPTVEEVDGGLFEDATTGLSATEGEYEDLGAAVETFPTSSPEAFKNATLGRCVYANNRFGAQCVSLSRSFWFSYAGRDVSTCGTGMAKGMMNCWQENAGNDFETHWGIGGVQSGDWIIWGTGQYGHVAMALGPQSGNYVTVLGENQGGRLCEGGGAATNIINLNVNGVIGYYRPKAYIKPTPTPTPTPAPSDKVTVVVKKGDTLGQILRDAGYTGTHLFGNTGLAQKVAEQNGIKNRGLIFPKQTVVVDKAIFNQF